jgi:hypothetical protein
MADMDARLILAGRAPDIWGSYDRGLQTAQNEIGAQRQNALAALYQEQGPAIMAGEPNALAALAGQDPGLAMGMRQAQQDYGFNAERMQFDRQRAEQYAQQAAREAEAWVMDKSAAEVAQAQAEAEAAMARVVAPHAMAIVKAMQGDPQAQQQVARAASQMGMSPDEFMTQAFAIDAITRQINGMVEVMGVKPEPAGPLSPEGKVAEDVRQGFITPQAAAAATAPKPPENEANIDNFLKMPLVKDFPAILQGYERIRTGEAQDSGVGDIAIVYGYMKLLDPTSVVREGEFATAEQVGGAAQQFLGLYNRLMEGERLTPEMRTQFTASAEKLYANAEAQLTNLEGQFKQQNPGLWLPDMRAGVVPGDPDDPPPDAGAAGDPGSQVPLDDATLQLLDPETRAWFESYTKGN